MWAIYLCIGIGIGMGIMAIHYARSDVNVTIKQLEREIAGEKLAEAKELHYAAVLRHVIASELQAEK